MCPQSFDYCSLFGNLAGWLLSSWVLVGLIGLAVGLVELVARYRDSPVHALLSAPAVFYMLLNLTACIVCLYLLITIKPSWIYGDPERPVDSRVRDFYLVLTAGFGAAAVFRSAIFKLKTPDAELAVGPSLILDTLLAAADRGVDRFVAAPRGALIADLMKDVSFDRAKQALPAYCFALMQNPSQTDQKNVADVVNSLNSAAMADSVRALNLGLAMLNVVGEKVLRRAVQGLGEYIKREPAAKDRAVAKVAEHMAAVDFERAKVVLPLYCFSLAKGVPDTEQEALRKQVLALSDAVFPPRTRTLVLGMWLTELVGLDVLALAVEQLGGDIAAAPPAPAGPP